jgi:signal transduction histidine kinase
VTLPRPIASPQDTSTPLAVNAAERGVVWVVDDSPLEAEVAARQIALDHEVLTFNDGPTVLERLAGGAEPDLLVLDWHMPDMSGLDVCRFIRESYDQTTLPILILTATGGQQDIIDGLQAGANDFVVKVSDPAELLARVRTLVRARLLYQRAQRAEAAAHRARRVAEAANEAKDAFMATVSHELRTPLGSILGWAQLLKENSPDEQTLKRGLETIERNAKIQVQLIEDILDTARVMSGKLQLERAPVDLVDVVQAAIDALKPAADAKRVSVAVEYRATTTQLYADADRLQQAVWNILSNATKFTPAGGFIHIDLASSKNELELTVTDSGKGISPEFLPHVFDRFKQQDSTATRRHSGLGLGLALVRHIVGAHRGEVSAHSEGEGRGATFKLRLPLDDSRELHAPPPDRLASSPPSSMRSMPVGKLANLSILVVEDDEDWSDLVAALLVEQGAKVDLANSADEALSKIAVSCPDLLLSDVGLPMGDGYELVRLVRKQYASERLPAIALTAFGGPEAQQLALDAGFQAHLAKPVEPGTLLRVVSDVARGRSPSQS